MLGVLDLRKTVKLGASTRLQTCIVHTFRNLLQIKSVPVAQWIARWTSNPKVPGSNPGRDASTLLIDPE